MIQPSEKMQIEFRKAKNALLEAQKIVIISHRSPDGDAVGTNLALRMALEELGKKVISASVDSVPDNSQWLTGAENFVRDFDYAAVDIVVTVDCADLKLVKFHETKPEILSGQKPFINFDHHESNNNYGSINCVDDHACATAFIMYQFLNFCDWKINIDMATALLHGIYFDTGSLMHSNTTAAVYEVASDLMMKGADIKRIAKELFHTTPVNRLRLWGRILERTYVNEEGVTVSAVNRNDYLATQSGPHDTGGVIDYLNGVPDSKFCVLLSEDENGRVKGSLRTQREDVNLSEVAGKWGGGGHPKASGFGLLGKLKPIMNWKIVPPNSHSEEQEIEF